jgi:hypothetical protein
LILHNQADNAAKLEHTWRAMPESEPETGRTRQPGHLNEAQQRRLIITCKYIDSLLSDMESALQTETSKSPFPHYVVNITAEQAKEIENHIRRFRSQLLQILEWQNLKPEPPEIPVTRSITTDLAFIEIAIEELKPRYLRGCGAVPADAVDGLNEEIHKLLSLVKSMKSYLRHEFNVNTEAKAEL